MSSAVDDPRRQQIHGFGMASHAAGYGPQFNNPFQTVAGQQQNIYPTSNESYLSIDPLSKLPQQHPHQHAVSSASGPASTAAPMTLSYQPAPIYASDPMRMNALAASAPSSYPGDVAFSSAAMPPPSLYPSGATSGPVYDSGYPTGYLPSNAPSQHMPDRRMSQPHVNGDYPRAGTTLSSAGPQFGNNFLDALEASKGLMDMGHDLTDATPRAERQRNTSDGYFPTPHSNASSISGGSSYSSYFGSMDSNASGYSSSTDLETLGHPQRLPGVSGLLSQNVASSIPPAPQSMMTQFSSKVSTGTPKKHKCKICDKRFTRPSSLQTHIYSHTGEKPFVCTVEGCGRHFSVVSNLRRHAKVHRNGDNESESYTDTDHGSPTSEVSTQDSVSSINEE